MSAHLDQPKNYQAIMVSSTFTDLKDHRKQVITAIEKLGYRANVMEYSGAQAEADVIDASLQMVRDSAAYVGVISLKYGQTPKCPDRNPTELSITELEFNEARRLGRPILLFIMGPDHPVKQADVELDVNRRKKLEAFQTQAKRKQDGSEVHRIYEIFNSLAEFSAAAAVAIGRLLPHLTSENSPTKNTAASGRGNKSPSPPDLLALPNYLGSHKFVGRLAELQTLSDWCAGADPHPMLLFEAIGGTGKSMLTWEWVTNHATGARADWAGRFWYSFYEKGAILSDFCRAALTYMTASPAEEFAALDRAKLAERLIIELKRRPWLIVLDGLERILVQYHRVDAALLSDEEANSGTDQIGQRDPRQATRPEDDDLLRRLADAAPSKILLTSRLTPVALLKSGTTVPGVRRVSLPGLRPPDAEAMIRACGVSGASADIQAYLQTNCDCHPLVIGALAGLINDYPRDRGSFDQWSIDPQFGGALDLAKLDLVQRRNHILQAAIDALSGPSRRLLQTLALLVSGADYDTLAALSLAPASQPLVETIADVERRGLLQYEQDNKGYDLHPVVRSVVAGRMARDETQLLGQRVIDHFNNRPHRPWEQASTLAEVENGLHVVRVLLRMQRFEEAAEAALTDLGQALFVNLQAASEVLALLKPFFPNGWSQEPVELSTRHTSYLLNYAALALQETNPKLANSIFEKKLIHDIEQGDIKNCLIGISNFANLSSSLNKLAEAERLHKLVFGLAEAVNDQENIFTSKLDLYFDTADRGDDEGAERLWNELAPISHGWDRSIYRRGTLEIFHASHLHRQGKLTDQILSSAEELVQGENNRPLLTLLTLLRGNWHLSRQEYDQAIESFHEVVRRGREIGRESADANALLALAHLGRGDQFDARSTADRLNDCDSLEVAELWKALGEPANAKEVALRTHRFLVADGEPFVRRHDLDRCRKLLAELGADLPPIPTYDADNTTHFPWEEKVASLTKRLRSHTKKTSAKSRVKN